MPVTLAGVCVEFDGRFRLPTRKPVPFLFYSVHHLFQQTNASPGLISEGTGGLTELNAPDPASKDTGNAPGNETSGTWLRVLEAVAGPNWGSQFTPRIGTEVLIDFVDGDMDQPVIVGQLYNGVDTPPFAAGVDAGVNHGGVLSGWHSHNLAAFTCLLST